jgi:hypothetical protein
MFVPYSYTDRDRQRTEVSKTAFNRTTITGGDVRDFVVVILDYLGHSKGRDK